MTLDTGHILNNRYRIVRLLGQGGFGAIYRAWDINIKAPCAIKHNTETSEDAARQFSREASMLANLRHPHLPRVYDHFTLPGYGQYLVMDFIEGKDLQEMLDEAKAAGSTPPLSEAQALNWILQVCSALKYLHSRTPLIIHRDLKPANIRITPDGEAILVDFGIAKIYDAHTATTLAAKAVTPGFSPPEQYSGKGTDNRSDIYALGATLYALMTGETPPESVIRMAEQDELIPPSHFNPSISPAVEAAILKSMQISASQRFQRIEEFQAALATTITSQDISPAVESPQNIGALPVLPTETASTKPEEAESQQTIPEIHIQHAQLINSPTTATTAEQTLNPPIAIEAPPSRRKVKVGLVAGIVLGILILSIGLVALGTDSPILVKTVAALFVATQTMAPDYSTATQRAINTATEQEVNNTATSVSKTEIVQNHATFLSLPAEDILADPSQWPLLLSEPFISNLNNWDTGSQENDYFKGTLSIENDKYIWDTTAKQSFDWWSCSNVGVIADFYLSVEGQRTGGSPDAYYGIVFREDGNNFYDFRVSNDGSLSANLKKNDQWVDLIPWRKNGAVHVSRMNRITVIAQGSKITFFVNDIFVYRYKEDSSLKGKICLMVGLEKGNAVFEFDNLELRGYK